MSAENCPFTLKGSDTGIDEIRKDRYVSFLVPLDPDDPDRLKSKEEIKKCQTLKPKKYLRFYCYSMRQLKIQTYPKEMQDFDYSKGY